jgi:hypothetical protein
MSIGIQPGEGDDGIYNIGTVERAGGARPRERADRLHLREACARGCRTASIQSTPMAESVYAGVGFRDLGRIIEYASRVALP